MTAALLPQTKHAESDEGAAWLYKSAIKIDARLSSKALSTESILFVHVDCSFDFISSVSFSQAAIQSSNVPENPLHA